MKSQVTGRTIFPTKTSRSGVWYAQTLKLGVKARPNGQISSVLVSPAGEVELNMADMRQLRAFLNDPAWAAYEER